MDPALSLIIDVSIVGVFMIVGLFMMIMMVGLHIGRIMIVLAAIVLKQHEVLLPACNFQFFLEMVIFLLQLFDSSMAGLQLYDGSLIVHPKRVLPFLILLIHR